MKPEPIIRLTPGKRVLFLMKDPELIRKQLRGELDLQMKNLSIDDLLDDINTDAMTPAWVCFSHKPEDIARDAYAGLIVDGKRLFEHDALRSAFAQLPAQCQKLLGLLTHDPPLSYAEISNRLNMSIGGIGPNRARCLDRLRRCPPLAAWIRADPDSGRKDVPDV